MAEISTITPQPEDFVQDGVQYTYKWNPRTVTDEGEGAWSIVPKGNLVYTPDRPQSRLLDNLSTSTNSGTAPAALTTKTELAPLFTWSPLLSASIDNSKMISSLNERPLPLDPKHDEPAAASVSSSIVQGMFPEVDAMQRALYQQKQNEAMQAQAMQYAKLSPFEKASYGLAMGGQQLGDAIGGALGAKDPQLQMIGLQQQILRELIPGNPTQNIQSAQK